jgi:hypothetical protein
MGGGGYNPGQASHAALLEIRRTLRQHPAVLDAYADPPAQFTQVRTDLDPRVLGGTSESGSLTVRWYEGQSAEEPPEFVFHYSDESGFDCGWHHEPNPHVDGWGHYQERESPDEEYSYESVTFGSEIPVRVCWEVMERLEGQIGSR